MKKGFLVIILCLLAKSFFGQQFVDLYGDYLGQTPPGDTAVILPTHILGLLN